MTDHELVMMEQFVSDMNTLRCDIEELRKEVDLLRQAKVIKVFVGSEETNDLDDQQMGLSTHLKEEILDLLLRDREARLTHAENYYTQALRSKILK